MTKSILYSLTVPKYQGGTRDCRYLIAAPSEVLQSSKGEKSWDKITIYWKQEALALESVIGAKVRDSEERICRVLFKLAVEQNSLAKIMAREYEEYDTYLLDEIRQESICEVKETNGTIRIREHFE